MASIKNGVLRASNAEILNEIRKNAPDSYKDRVPEVTQGQEAAALKQLNKYPDLWNTAVPILRNVIGLQIVRNPSFTNKFSFLFDNSQGYGKTIEEMQVNLLKARAYDKSLTDVWRADGRRPDVHVNYHTMNRQLAYDIVTPMADMLRGAFNESSRMDSLLNAMLAAPRNSLENDTQLGVLQLIKHYQDFEGFYNYHIDPIATADDPAAVCRQLVKGVAKLKIDTEVYTTRFSAEGRSAGLATNTRDSILIIDSTMASNLTVEMLAYMFHDERGELMADRVISVPSIPGMPDGSAIWLDADWFICRNELGPIMLDAPINPLTMEQLSTLHCWQTLSYSRFCNAVSFTTAADTDVAQLNSTVTGVKLVDAAGNDSATLQPTYSPATGELQAPATKLVATVEGANGPSQAVRFELHAYNGRGRGIGLPDRCFIASDGTLTCGGVPAGGKVIVRAVSLQDESKTADFTATVEGTTAATSVASAPASLAVVVGKSVTGTVTVKPDDATDGGWTAALANDDGTITLATDRTHGTFTVTGVKAGSATVILSATGAGDAPVTAAVTVTVTAE